MRGECSSDPEKELREDRERRLGKNKNILNDYFTFFVLNCNRIMLTVTLKNFQNLMDEFKII